MTIAMSTLSRNIFIVDPLCRQLGIEVRQICSEPQPPCGGFSAFNTIASYAKHMVLTTIKCR